MNNIIIDSDSPFRIRRDIDINNEHQEDINIPNLPYIINIMNITHNDHEKIKKYYGCEIPHYEIRTRFFVNFGINNIINVISLKYLSLRGIYFHILINGFNQLNLLNEKDKNFIIKTCNFYDLTFNIDNQNIPDNSISFIGNGENVIINNRTYDKIVIIVNYYRAIQNFNLIIGNSTISELTIIVIDNFLINNRTVIKNVNGTGTVNINMPNNEKFIVSDKKEDIIIFNYSLYCDEIETNCDISLSIIPSIKLTVNNSNVYVNDTNDINNIISCDLEYRGKLKSINMDMINENINSLNICANKNSVIESIDITKLQRIDNVNVDIRESKINSVVCNDKTITDKFELLNELKENVNLRNKNISINKSCLDNEKLTNKNIPFEVDTLIIDENFNESKLKLNLRTIGKLIIKKKLSSIEIDCSYITKIVIDVDYDRFDEVTIKNSCIDRIECNKILNISKINCITSNIKESNLNVYNNVNELIINNKHVGTTKVNKLLSLDNIISIIRNDSLTKLNLSCINIYIDSILDLTHIKNVHLESIFGNKILMHENDAINCIFQQ